MLMFTNVMIFVPMYLRARTKLTIQMHLNHLSDPIRTLYLRVDC